LGTDRDYGYAEAEHGGAEGVKIYYVPYNDGNYTFTYSDEETIRPPLPGKYVARFVTTDTDYEILTSEDFYFEITAREITPPDWNNPKFPYRGGTTNITSGLTDGIGYTIEDVGGINIGSYVAVASLTSEYYVWKETKSVEDIHRFIADKDVVVSWKLDGLTIVLRYQGGFLTKAVTRGRDGTVGEDVTDTVKYFRNVPRRIKETGTIEIRGEGVMSWNDHKILTRDSEQASNHPRNVAASLTRTTEVDKGRLNHIDFIAFDLIESPYNFELKSEQLSFISKLGLMVVPYQRFNKYSGKTLEDTIKSFNPEEFSYPADGIIFEYEDVQYGKSLGATSHHERRLMALKWADEEYETTFTGVELVTTRTGIVSIIALFDEVNINGSKISRANIPSLTKFESYEFGEGDTIKVYNANMIVSQIAENVTKSGTFKLPKYCPCCGEVLEEQINKNGVKNLYCPNEECMARNAQRLARFCDKDAMDLEGLSAVLLEKLMAYGWIKNYVDLYHIEDYKEEIINTIGFGPATFKKIYNAVENSRKTNLGKFLVGMGIPKVGPEVGSVLNEYYYGSFEKFEEDIKNEYSFSHISGVPYMAEQNIYKWYNDKKEMR
jgi:DNA ligase (NAD+)